MTPRTRHPILLLLWLLAASSALAQGANDRDQPIQVEADRMSYDDTKQTNVFSGRVQMNRGTLSIRADRIILRQDETGTQFATATGSPASFRQRRVAAGEVIEGYAQTLEYDTRSETVLLRDKASMQRMEGERVVNEVFGALIRYESRTEHFTVERGDAASATAANPGGRVRVVIQPKADGGGAKAASPASPPTLTPSDRLAPPAGSRPASR